jgi:predicted peptidase
MRRLLCLFLYSICLMGCQKYLEAPEKKNQGNDTKPAILIPHTVSINNVVKGFYSAVPANYDENSKLYPTLIFIHGAGQYGNGSYDLPLLLNEAVPQLLDEKKFPPLFHVNGEEFSMLVLVPQFTVQPATYEVIEFIQYAIENYRIDTNRIYMTGFSSGGRTLVDVAADYPNRFAAIVPIAGSANYNANEKSHSIAAGNIRVWGFHNLNDQLIDHTETKNFIEAIRTFNPGLPARMTIFPGYAGTQAHDAWTKATNSEYREEGKNIYEWMLQFKR